MTSTKKTLTSEFLDAVFSIFDALKPMPITGDGSQKKRKAFKLRRIVEYREQGIIISMDDLDANGFLIQRWRKFNKKDEEVDSTQMTTKATQVTTKATQNSSESRPHMITATTPTEKNNNIVPENVGYWIDHGNEYFEFIRINDPQVFQRSAKAQQIAEGLVCSPDKYPTYDDAPSDWGSKSPIKKPPHETKNIKADDKKDEEGSKKSGDGGRGMQEQVVKNYNLKNCVINCKCKCNK